MSWPKVGDNIAELVDQLKRLNRNLDGGGGGDTTIEETVNIDGGAGAFETDGNAVYFTTGRSGMTLDSGSDDWEEVEFGFQARTINMRFDVPMYVSFVSPFDRGSAIIPLDPAADAPFTIGGDGGGGIDTENIWLKSAEDTDEDPLVHLIAYR